jgi:hypothetical protein
VVLAATTRFGSFSPTDPSRLVRFLQDGSLDPVFGEGGLVTLPVLASGQEPIVDLSIDSSRRLLATLLNRPGFDGGSGY